MGDIRLASRPPAHKDWTLHNLQTVQGSYPDVQYCIQESGYPDRCVCCPALTMNKQWKTQRKFLTKTSLRGVPPARDPGPHHVRIVFILDRRTASDWWHYFDASFIRSVCVQSLYIFVYVYWYWYLCTPACTVVVHTRKLS